MDREFIVAGRLSSKPLSHREGVPHIDFPTPWIQTPILRLKSSEHTADLQFEEY
jgi:hypothetical protein